MQKSSFASSVPNICRQGSRPPPPWQPLLACKTLPLLVLFFFFKPHVNFFSVNLSTTAFPTRCQGAAEKSGDVLTPTCSADLLKFTFPDDSRLGRCAKSGSADTPPAARLPFLLISFPRSTLCQTYSSGVAQYLYICQAQRENESCTCHAALKKQPNF